MNFKARLVKLWNGFENLFFTNHACLSCRKEIPDGTNFSLCKNCLESIEVLNENICETCGDKILENNKICDRCKTSKFSFDKSRSFSIYEDVSARLVKRFKYSGKKYYSEHLADLMLTRNECFENIDYITFVPIGTKRRKERGFNQAEELANQIGKKTNIPVIDTLEKLGSERHQAGLSQKERQENLSGTFKLKEGLSEIKDKNVLLIDDVFTTGATLSECAKVLKSDKKNKPNKVLCYTFAKTKLNSTNNGHFQQNNIQENETK